MRNNDKNFAHESQKLNRNLIHARHFVEEIINDDKKKLILITYAIGSFFVFYVLNNLSRYNINLNVIEYLNYYLSAILLILFIGTSLISIWSGALFDRYYRAKLQAIGLVNATGIAPILLKYRVHDKNIDMMFNNVGLSLESWKDKLVEIETILNISIAEIKYGFSNQEIIITGCKGRFNYSKTIYWSNNLVSNDDCLIMGKSINKTIDVNLNIYPHILLGGSTGSGKTLLLKILLLQCIQKGYIVNIADFKGGVDYPSCWKTDCNFVSDIDDTIKQLHSIIKELESRKQLLSSLECRNITEYNKQDNKELQRIIFACDEVAELLDTTGLSAKDKEPLKEIQNLLNTIARQGRAFGIHLILATQRPDAQVLTGQIKSNIDYKVCGRANDVLSQIILDSTIATDRIPSDSQGLFINQDEQLFKAYYVDEDNIDLGGGTMYP